MLAFKRKRLFLGLNQTRAGLDLEELASEMQQEWNQEQEAEEEEGDERGAPSNSLSSSTYSQSQVCRIERLDITPRQAKALRPILMVSFAQAMSASTMYLYPTRVTASFAPQKWLSLADARYLGRRVKGCETSSSAAEPSSSPAPPQATRRRRQRRTQFSAKALAELNKEFLEDPTPNQYKYCSSNVLAAAHNL